MSERYLIAFEDLPEDLQGLAGVIGMENTLALVRHCGGTSIYIHKSESIMRQARNRRIRDEFDGRNHRDLAKRYNLSESRIRAILAGNDIDDIDRPQQAALF